MVRFGRSLAQTWLAMAFLSPCFAENLVFVPAREASKENFKSCMNALSKRPFVAYNKFDTAQFADYGTRFYDKHEENLDETGKNINPEARLTTMQEVSHRQQAQSRSNSVGSAGHVPHMQIKTYGRPRQVSP